MCMDTIIYFYKKRGLREPVIEEKVQNEVKLRGKTGAGAPKPQEYLLVRVGLDLEGEKWFGQSAGQTMSEEDQALLDTDESEMPDKRGILGVLRRARWKRREQRRRREAQERQERLLLAREARLKEVESQMRRTAERILKRADEERLWGYVCQERLKGTAVWKEWLKRFPLREFDGYARAFWVRQLLPEAVHPRFVILGSCEDICELVEDCARRMKSLRWILREQECTREILDFAEDFYVEYGLAVAMQTVSGRSAYRKLRLACGEPASILDFTGEPAVNLEGVAEGSVWLDMKPSEEKRRRIAERGTGIRYFSLKENWGRT